MEVHARDRKEMIRDMAIAVRTGAWADDDDWSRMIKEDGNGD